MLATLRTPTGGAIHYTGRPDGDWDTDALRARIGVMTQDYHKWPFTAATNIAVGDVTTHAEQTRIEAAASRAVAHDMITELSHGYETLLDRTFAGGQDLSGGQWQRITAARGFLRDADVLIMDEPSSALDPRAEDALFRAIRDRQGHAITILITHPWPPDGRRRTVRGAVHPASRRLRHHRVRRDGAPPNRHGVTEHAMTKPNPTKPNPTKPSPPTLVIIRGNSGSGKTTTAREAAHRTLRGRAAPAHRRSSRPGRGVLPGRVLRRDRPPPPRP